MDYVGVALALSVVIYFLGKLEVLNVVPWVFVAFGLDIFAAMALFSGRYERYVPEEVEDRRIRRQETAVRENRARQKRRKRRSRQRG